MASRIKKSVPKGVKAPFPVIVEPMLCLLVNAVPEREDYIYEVKLDGYRIIGHIQKGHVALKTKNALNYSKRYEPITKRLEQLKADMVLDGEIVVVDEEGKHDFNMLESYQRTRHGHLIYYVFDILWLNGYDLRQLELTERKVILQQQIHSDDLIRIVDTFQDGTTLFEQTLIFGFEGIICKNIHSPYLAGKRGRNWLKIKHKKRDEFIIIGFIPSESLHSFKTLLLGKYIEGKLHYIHHSGGGYTDQVKKELYSHLKNSIVKKTPVVNATDVNVKEKPVWVKPSIVAEFEREEKTTKSGRQRHPIIFKAIREDKKPTDVTLQLPVNTKSVLKNKKSPPQHE